MGNMRNAVTTFCKAQFSAWIATCVDFSVSLVLARACGLWYAYATFLGAVSGGVTNCFINYRWVFNAIGMQKSYVALRYVCVWVVSIALNTMGTYQLTQATGIDFIIVKAVVAVLVAVLWNYQMQRVFVFHANNREQVK